MAVWGQQTAAPWSFFQGLYAPGTYTTDMPGRVAVVLTDILITNNNPSTTAGVQLKNDSGGYLFQVNLTADALDDSPPFQWHGEAEIGQPAGLELLVFAESVVALVSGYLVIPPSVDIVPS